MKLLSLWNPWAVLMAIDAKHWETRSWSTTYRGPIAIQATKSFNQDCKDLCRTHPFMMILDRAGFFSPAHVADTGGKVLCVVDLVDCIRTDGLALNFFHGRGAADHEESFGNYAPGRFAWVTNNLRRLVEPVPVTGVQGLRDLSADDEAKVRKQLP